MGGIGPDHNIVQLLRTLFCEVMFQRKAAAWKSNQIILSDVVLHILKDVMILQFFSLVLTSHTLNQNRSQSRSKIHSKTRPPTG